MYQLMGISKKFQKSGMEQIHWNAQNRIDFLGYLVKLLKLMSMDLVRHFTNS